MLKKTTKEREARLQADMAEELKGLVKEIDRQAAQAYLLLAAMDDADLRRTFGHFQTTLSALRNRCDQL